MAKKDEPKVTRTYTARGMLKPSESPLRVNLFDGRFDTGFRIKSFVVSPYGVDNTNVRTYLAKLTTSPGMNVAVWDWGDQRELAWSFTTWDANGVAAPNEFTRVDSESIIVEDLYVYVDEPAGGTDQFTNYMIELEQVSMSEWEGALSMARDKASGGQ